MSVEGALAAGRAIAAARMRDTCRITATVSGGWNDASGTYDEPSETVVYEGPCRVRQPSPTGSRVESGEAGWTVDSAILSLPIAGSAGVGPGHVATITASADDPAKVGLRLTVQATQYQTDSTARRLPVKVVSRDA